jgi:hypothetical protein
MNTVLAHTSGLAATASSLLATKFAPAAGMAAGCSEPAPVVPIQDTAGRLSLTASYSNRFG